MHMVNDMSNSLFNDPFGPGIPNGGGIVRVRMFQNPFFSSGPIEPMPLPPGVHV